MTPVGRARRPNHESSALHVRSVGRIALLGGSVIAFLLAARVANAQLLPQSTSPAEASGLPGVPPQLIGRTIDEVRVDGNLHVSTQVILNLVRSHVGDKFEPGTVSEDYQRIFGLNRFSNVHAAVEPEPDGGVDVVFTVTEEKLVHAVRFVGNSDVATTDLQKAINVKTGEAIEPFRISLAKRAILTLYKEKNHPFASVTVPDDELSRRGNVVFQIVEGPHVRIRNIRFLGAHAFTFYKLNDQIKTTRWYWIFNAGTFDPDEVDDDVATLAHFYQDNGYFDARVGRKLIFSPDQTELQIDFVIDEGPRYKVDKVTFTGNTSLSDAKLRGVLKLTEGRYFDSDLLQRDVNAIVKAYSPLGFIYDPQSDDPTYLRIGRSSSRYGAKIIYRRQAGGVELIYDITEGKPFRFGRIIVKGNAKTQEKVILREMHVAPGQIYNSGEITDATQRLRGLPLFDNVSITPIGDSPDTRDVLVEVHEARTANFSVGGGVNSNGGLNGNVTFEQKNFDVLNPPTSFDGLLNEHAFTGAGQTFRATFEPGTQLTNASLLFGEPYLFDQPYSGTAEAFFQDYLREAWYERHAGGRFTFGHRLDYTWSVAATLRAEDVKVGGIEDYAPLSSTKEVIDHRTGLPTVNPRTGTVLTQFTTPRAPEVIAAVGHNTVTALGFNVRRDTTNRGPLLYEGSNATFGYEYVGGLGGEYNFNRINLGYDSYRTLYADLSDRRTILQFSADSAYIPEGAAQVPFFERFYGGGIGSIRGFEYRGVSPRNGRALDPVGGNFDLTSTLQLSFPLYGEGLRGVAFTDVGTVEPDIRIHTIRASVGAGIRLVLPFLGQAPLALDLAVPVNKRADDNVQFFSFSFGSNF